MNPLAQKTKRLHPTKRKVLGAVAGLTQDGGWATSSDVRQDTGISQQLLNRHLRALEEMGLVKLNNPGPGLPLEVAVTPEGLASLEEQTRPRPPVAAPAPKETPPEPAPEPEPEPPSQTAQGVSIDLATETEAGPAAPSSPPEEEEGLEIEPQEDQFPETQPEHWVELSVDLEAPPPPTKASTHGIILDTDQTVEPVDSPAPLPEEPHMTPLADVPPEPPAQMDKAEAARKLELFAQVVSRSLSPHIKDLSPREVSELVGKTAADVLGLPLPEAEKPPEGEWFPAQAPAEPESTPTELSPTEAALEKRLATTAHAEYLGMPWHERTYLMSNAWDRALRRHLGYLNTRFSDFSPRWERHDWKDFNQARRQADFNGARYPDWVQAQFERLETTGDVMVPPEELHGDAAASAFQTLPTGVEPTGEKPSSKAPYTQGTFDLQNQEHVAFVEEALDEVAAKAKRMFRGDPGGTVRLLVQAMDKGEIPLAALELRPQWKVQVLDALRPGGAQDAKPAPPEKKEEKPKFVI